MSKTYILIDFSNLFFRMKHTSMKGATTEERLGLVIHQMLAGIASAWHKFDADHCIFAMEGKTWRKQFYPEYKLNRQVLKLKKTEAEQELDEEFFMAANNFSEFLQEKTAASVITAADAEADDVIATFIYDHPNDLHIIVSSDSDFHQLICNNVTIFNPMQGQYITTMGIYDMQFKPIIDEKTKSQKMLGDPEYILFKKCIRGDSSDNVKSAYPRIREKSTKNIVGIDAAFADRHAKSFDWNTVMLAEWTDHNNVTHVVKDLYLRNQILIDLREIPEVVREQVREAIRIESEKEIRMSNVGFAFMQFCGKWQLIRISENPTYYTDFLSKSFPKY